MPSLWSKWVACGLIIASLVMPAGPALSQGLPRFEDDTELVSFLETLRGEGVAGEMAETGFVAYMMTPPPPPPPASVDMAQSDMIVVTGSRMENPSITNNQVAGVDEGGIVKVAGDYLVILRRGRLFTVSTADDTLAAIDRIDAFPDGLNGAGGWYDEMLVSGDLIIVVGYSYAYSATEVSRFRVSSSGELSHVDTHHLRSEDYYSSRNYASRLIGDELVFYAPLPLNLWRDADPLESLPALSRWAPGQEEPDLQRTAAADDVYIPEPLKKAGNTSINTLHVVTRCDLASEVFSCAATVVLGPSGRNFFVSTDATYVWITPGWHDRAAPGYLYRIPLDGRRPGAVQVAGAPLDQFSFHPNPDQDRLDVLVLPDGHGEGMWLAEHARGRPALLRLDMDRFGDGRGAAPDTAYQLLDTAEDVTVSRNRFIGDWLLLGINERDDASWSDAALAVGVESRREVRVPLDAELSRIEALGSDALLVTQDDDTVFATLDLDPEDPVITDRLVFRNSAEAEQRSHAFFYRPSGEPDTGLAALPLLSYDDRAALVFFARDGGSLTRRGRLGSRAGAWVSDDCQASCVDWYGNARPIFLGDRIFALLGYELVEGELGDKRIEETGRVNFTPPPPAARPVGSD